MPSNIYLRSGDEFIVTQPYAVALERWTARSATRWNAEFTVAYWRDPRHIDDEDDDDRPLYREGVVTFDLGSIIAIERLQGPLADGLERARKAQAERADEN